MTYNELKADIQYTFTHVNGLASSYFDRYAEGHIFTGHISRYLFRDEWASEFNLTDHLTPENRMRPIVICDDIKQMALIAPDFLNPEFVATDEKAFCQYRELNEDMWMILKTAFEAIQWKYYNKKTMPKEMETKISWKTFFHNEVMMKEVDKMFEDMPNEIERGHSHIIIHIPFEGYGLFIQKRMTEAGFKCEMAKDNSAVWVVINPVEEQRYLEAAASKKDYPLNHNWPHNDGNV